MINKLLLLSGKLASFTSKNFHLGHGGTWPGHVALKLNPNFVSQTIHNTHIKTILVAGTNGKTTTSKMITAILEKNGYKVLHNASGANLLNGIASVLIQHSNIFGKLDYDVAILEVDENTLPQVLKEITPDYLLLLNLFRDQLDRYGEVRTIASKWKKAIESIPSSATLVLNSDDPEIAYLGENISANVKYFGLDDKKLMKKPFEHAADSIYCPKCDTKLSYTSISFSHLGDWQCKNCKLKRPTLDSASASYYPLKGLYNKYNTVASCLLSNLLGINEESIEEALKNFSPAFGRQEKIQIGDKFAKILLSKNPVSFNQSLATIMEQKPNAILFVLNDRVPDGHDVSWIWDTDIEGIMSFKEEIIISGDRAYDMGLRIKYAMPSKFHPPADGSKSQIEPKLENAIKSALDKTGQGQTLYILPTYSAMLDVRKIITGKKIL